MEFREALEVPPATLLAVSEHLRKVGSNLSVDQAATIAIEEWLLANRQPAPRCQPDPLRGYQWKEVFLPDGTDLRMSYDCETYYARVMGDQLMYQGRRVSPRFFTQLVAPGVRNAWRDLWVRLPGTRAWKRASALRKELEKSATPQSPADTINAAAACMSDALKTALTLVEQSNAQAVRKFERRLERHRRESDVLADHCSFD
jgi:hypothetical protein